MNKPTPVVVMLFDRNELELSMCLGKLTDNEILTLQSYLARKKMESEQTALKADPAQYYNDSPNKGPPAHTAKAPKGGKEPKPSLTHAQLVTLLEIANVRVKVLEGELAECRTQLDRIEERDLERRLREE